MKTHEIKGLIFDCDGTLADTMPLHWYAWRSIAELVALPRGPKHQDDEE